MARATISANTEVTTNDGLRPINGIPVGDTVLAYNEATGETGFYRVTDTMLHVDPTVIHLTIDGELIETTPEHPFYTLHGGWVIAGELRMGDRIHTADSGYSVVEGISILHTAQPMYNLTVDTAHTFFVGDVGALVHNACRIEQVSHDQRAIQAREKYELGDLGPDSGNVAIGDYLDSNGNLLESVTGISGWHRTGENPFPDTVDLLPKGQRRFDTLMHTEAYPGSNPRIDFDRAVDAEAKTLEYYANQFDPNRLGGNPEVTGTIHLYTERFPCPSCGGSNGLEGVIGQFNQQFPGVDVVVKYSYGP